MWKGFWGRNWLLCEEIINFFPVCTWELYNVIENYRNRSYFFNGCEGQNFDSHSFTSQFFFVVGYNDEVFLYVRLFVHHMDRLPLMVSCLVAMNRWPTCPSVWLLQEQIPIFGLTCCVHGHLVKTGLSKWETSENPFSQVRTPFYCV